MGAVKAAVAAEECEREECGRLGADIRQATHVRAHPGAPVARWRSPRTLLQVSGASERAARTRSAARKCVRGAAVCVSARAA